MDTTETHGEILSPETTAVAVVTEQSTNLTATLLARLGVTGVKQVTRTVLQQVDGVPFAITFEGGAYTGQELKAGKGSGAKMEAARLANVLNLDTGAKQSLIMNTVLEGEFVRNYGQPDIPADDKGNGAVGAYVGRSFIVSGMFQLGPDGKPRRYRTYEIAEVFFGEDGAAAAENVVGVDVVADGKDPVARDGKSKPKG